MAYNTNNEELRRQALSRLQAAREEMTTEVNRLRVQLSPERGLHRMVDRHAGLVVFTAFTAGLVPAWLIFRGRRTIHLEPHLLSHQAPPKPVLGAILLGALGALANSAIPVLMKSTIIPHVLDFLARKQAAAASGRPPV